MMALLVGFTSATAQETQKFTAAKHNEYGLVYSLPVTHFDIEVTAEKIVSKAGPYYKYAKKYLSIDNPITADAQRLRLKDVVITPYGVADENNKYLVQFKKGSSPFMMLSSSGLPLAINREISTDVASMTTDKKNPVQKAVSPTDAFASVLPGELLVSESTAKRAEMAATMIYKIRESRTALITGEAEQMPPDGEAMKLVMKQLDEQESALMALFVGTQTTETITKHIHFVPSEELSRKVLFRVSDFNGIVGPDDLSGEPVYATLKITQRGELPVNEKGETKKLPKGAVMYNIPGEAQVTLEYKNTKISSGLYQVAQYGIQFGLDPDMFCDKKAPSYAIFYPETGAIKEIGLCSGGN